MESDLAGFRSQQPTVGGPGGTGFSGMAKEDGQFKKGGNWNGNSNGRPKKSETYSDTLRELLSSKKINITYTQTDKDGNPVKRTVEISADKNMYYGIATAQIEAAISGNVQAQKEIIDRIQGKAPQSIDMDTSQVIFQISEDYKPKPNADRNK